MFYCTECTCKSFCDVSDSIDKALRAGGNGSDPALSPQNAIYRQLHAHQQVSAVTHSRWPTTTILKIDKSRYIMMIENGSLERIGHPPSSVVKLNFNGQCMKEIHFAPVCEILWRLVMPLQRYRDFLYFLVKRKNSLDGRA